MTEQWFLDLDGTRSGPYHTPEIMSLVAEGEVLPHHRISTSLKDQPWVTVLDWRLDQAKISHSSPYSRTFRSEISAVEGITPQTPPVKEPDSLEESIADESEFLRNPEPELQYEAEPELPPEPEIEVPIAEPPRLQAKIKLEPRSAAITPPPSPLAPDSPFENYPEEIPSDLVPDSPAASAPPVGPPKLSPLNENRSKRDPMAEMFDMLQKTKKREISQASVRGSGISVIADDPGPKKSIPFSKTLGIGLGVIFIGFALGQLFQTSAPPTTTPNASATKASPSPASAASATPSTLLVDRSTDKMMIRANVNAAAPQPTRALPRATPVMTPHINPRMTPNESMQNEKEIEELKTLKKELQELKALKNNSGSGDLPEPELDEEGQVLDPAYNYDANGFPAQNPGGNPLSNPGIHPQGIPQGGEPPLVR